MSSQSTPSEQQQQPVQGQEDALAPTAPAPAPALAPKREKAPKASSGPSITLKVPKGTKDHPPTAMLLRERIFNTITTVFKLHGAVTIDTPVFELREILAGKYGEDSKLIYDLADQGGEICSLRYDLTVPFARFLAMNHSQYQNIKRYHIAKVYRRDQPAMTKGRMREFYQCDFDIAGSYDAMIPDAEVIEVVCTVLDRLDVGPYTIKINHRKVLDGVFQVCGVPADKIRTISSAVDKLDKLPWESVRKEMTEEKGLDGDVADKIGEYVKLKGGDELLAKLQADTTLTANASAAAGLADMELLFKYLRCYEVLPRISFDLSLARGLDYYTGVIYEAVVEASAPPAPPANTDASVVKKDKGKSRRKEKDAEGEEEVDESTVGVGSIAAGGRYDDLVGMFTSLSGGGKGKGVQIPCVGLSFGVERIYSILERKEREKGEAEGRGKEVDVFVMNMGDGLLEERMKVAKELWSAGITTEFLYKNKPKPPSQWSVIDRDRVPFVVIIGSGELEKGEVRIKVQYARKAAEGEEGESKEEEGDGKGVLVKRQEMVQWLRKRLGK